MFYSTGPSHKVTRLRSRKDITLVIQFMLLCLLVVARVNSTVPEYIGVDPLKAWLNVPVTLDGFLPTLGPTTNSSSKPLDLSGNL